MATANPQQRQFTLFYKFSTEVRPTELVQRDDRIRLLTCPFEEIAESEEEDTQFAERTSSDGRSPFAAAFDSPFAGRHDTSRNLSSVFARKVAVPQLCRGFSDPCLRRRQTPIKFGHLSPDGHDAVSGLFTLSPIPETASS